MIYLKKFEIVWIGISGYFAGLTVAQFNERLQTCVLILTVIGIIWKIIKPTKRK